MKTYEENTEILLCTERKHMEVWLGLDSLVQAKVIYLEFSFFLS